MRPPHELLSLGAHDRIAARREDEDWLAARWGEASTRVLVIAGTKMAPGPVWVAPSQAPQGVRVLLGERDQVIYAAVITSPDHAGADWVALRGLLPSVASGDAEIVDQAPLLLHAVGIAEWLWSTRFCPRCGHELRVVKAGHEQVCDNGHLSFPRTDPAVIMLIANGEPGSPEERALLGRHVAWPEGLFSTLAGFCEPGESLEDAVRRETLEEAGIQVGEVSYVGNQPWPFPASLMLGFSGRAISTDIQVDGVEMAQARWFTRAELKAESESGQIALPGGVSISRSLIEGWYGGPLPGR